MKSRLVVEALEDAMRKRGEPKGVIVHSDRGSQFRSRKFRAALKAYGAKGSMGRVGACGDNAAMESFFALVQKNVLAGSGPPVASCRPRSLNGSSPPTTASDTSERWVN